MPLFYLEWVENIVARDTQKMIGGLYVNHETPEYKYMTAAVIDESDTNVLLHSSNHTL